ncbi:oxidoreductase, short chain dehydrogenase/reductase family protein [Tritrichomonas foetus]|uniref:Oxidoreductase, short chain dehydrogenase/reductase family protein n=1 Tax=Tritrichomonas foetus TaxID=1144522 RepID=A0A1J4KTM4_9EUKA|nr:oxidoreductase, short chain dehydrogenase/reductase family protein [Tritrichomonas foetus]|eukprot:OHT13116.1 oxidoreductase, short chain dehydrogenase/reductase family protein [Tritrichomonas foetus]
MNLIIEIYIAIAILALLVFLYRQLPFRKTPMKGKNVVITGGSSGVGLAVAQECLNRGALNVVLIARGKEGLEKAKALLNIPSPKQMIYTIPADVSNWDSLKSAFETIKEKIHTIDYLFANAGFAKPGLLQDTSSDDFQKQIEVDFLGAAYSARLAFPLLAKNSHVTFSGSICSVFTFAGYASYGSAKYALKALAETLRNELKSSETFIHMGILSTVDTPGLKRENEVKPEVCAAIEGTANIFSPETIAKKLLQGIDRNDYYITMEFLSWIMLEIGFGIAPTSNIFMQLVFAPFIPLIRYGALFYVDFLARKPLPKPKID